MDKYRMCSISTSVGGELCSGDVLNKSNFSPEEWQLLLARSSLEHIQAICDFHQKELLVYFPLRQTKCCDPESKHVQMASKPFGVKDVTMDMHIKSKFTDKFRLKPGSKLCKRCAVTVSQLLDSVQIPPSETSSSSSSFSTSQDDNTFKKLLEEAGSVKNVIMGASRADSVSEDAEFGKGLAPLPGPSSSSPCSASQCDDSLKKMLEEAGSVKHIIMGPYHDDSGDLFADYAEALDEPRSQPPSKPQSQVPSELQSHSEPQSESSDKDPTFKPHSREAALSTLNTALGALDVSPVIKRKLSYQKSYGTEKLRRVEERCGTLMVEAGGIMPKSDREEIEFYVETMAGLKEKFSSCSRYSDKIMVLSVALISLSQAKVFSEFGPIGATDYMIRKTVSLMDEQGILPVPQQKKGRPLSEETVRLIQGFYEDDEVSSRQMPGMKDYVSVREGDKRVHKQKRLVLCNLKELYEMFLERYQIGVSFSKFATLRPKHCVLAGSSGTHTVCVCKYHQNFQLLIEAGNFQQLDPVFGSYKGFLSTVLCDPPTPNCYLEGNCPSCPGTEDLDKKLRDKLNEDFVEKVTYQQWTSTDRCNLEVLVKESDDFVDTLICRLKTLLPHHFISKQQAEYFKTRKENLEEGEVIIVCDFAENFTCIIQRAVQSFYWNNDQVTIHPFMCYLLVDGELVMISLAIISDHMKHDINAVYAFQKALMSFLKARYPGLKKAAYFSDGAAQQYKNKKNVLNINYHERDFGIKGEWHFFTTSHGKGPCDGLAGTLKRLAYKASLQDILIRNPLEFYEWALRTLTNINVCFVSTLEVQSVAKMLKSRFKNVLSVPQMRSQHSILSVSPAEVMTKIYSFSPRGKLVPVELVRKPIALNDIMPGQYVAIQQGKKWAVAEVLLLDPDSNSVLVNSFQRTQDPKKWESLMESEDHLEIDEIVTLVTPDIHESLCELSDDDLTRVNWQLRVMNSLGLN